MIYTTDVPRLGEGETSAVTLGKFDGLHRGHQKLMNCIREKKEDNCKAVIFTTYPCKGTSDQRGTGGAGL